MAHVSSIWAKGCILMIVCACYLTWHDYPSLVEVESHGMLPMRVRGATSQLDLPSLTPLSVAGCGRLQLGVPNWATSVDYN